MEVYPNNPVREVTGRTSAKLVASLGVAGVGLIAVAALLSPRPAHALPAFAHRSQGRTQHLERSVCRAHRFVG